MSVKLIQNATTASENSLKDEKHILFVLTETEEKDLAFGKNLHSKLLR
jgi:leucyl aminopeptidase